MIYTSYILTFKASAFSFNGNIISLLTGNHIEEFVMNYRKCSHDFLDILKSTLANVFRLNLYSTFSGQKIIFSDFGVSLYESASADTPRRIGRDDGWRDHVIKLII